LRHYFVISSADWYYQTRYHQNAPLQGQAVDTLYQDDPQQVQAMLHEARATGFWAGVLTHRGPDGQSFPAHVTAFAIRDAAGQTSAIATFVRDISEQMRQEQERLALQTHIIAAQRAAIRAPDQGRELVYQLWLNLIRCSPLFLPGLGISPPCSMLSSGDKPNCAQIH